MRIDKLMDTLSPDDHLSGPEDQEINGLTADSRAVRHGWLFAAFPGEKTDGSAYISDAIDKGATAVLMPQDTALTPGLQARLDRNSVSVITSAEPRLALARMAARFRGRQPESVVAITGTNGKTSTAVFTRRIWEVAGLPAASLGTLGTQSTKFDRPATRTTPEPVSLHDTLADLVDAGIDHVAMEASSHGLTQYRMHGVRIRAAAFTNFTQDHLDYHGTMEAYFAAKARLFSEVMDPGGVAVLNADDETYPKLAALARNRNQRVVGYGWAGPALRLLAVDPTPTGQTLTLRVEGHPPDITVHLPLVGRFQAMNALAALGLVTATGVSLDDALVGIGRLENVPGRIQHVATRTNGAPVYVDYAHTPDALETVLASLRPHCTGRLVCVFGAGGDRDPGKRPLMGAAVAKCADIAIVTDDNPRTEDPAVIRAAVRAACPEAKDIGDRAAAIRVGVSLLEPSDLLVVAGKGHEAGQTVGTEVLPFDDRSEARLAVTEMDSLADRTDQEIRGSVHE